MEKLVQDLRFGARMLVKNPGFTLVAVITMALGIGANTALFSVVNGVLLKSLPYKEPGRLMFSYETTAKLPNPVGASTLDYRDWKEQNHVFQSMGARRPFTVSLPGIEKPGKKKSEKNTIDSFFFLSVDGRSQTVHRQPHWNRTAGKNSVRKDHVRLFFNAWSRADSWAHFLRR